jgi:hypothetical protein
LTEPQTKHIGIILKPKWKSKRKGVRQQEITEN